MTPLPSSSNQTCKQILKAAYDAFHDFIIEEAIFDGPVQELPSFGDWASAHYGVCPIAAEEFFQKQG